MATLIPSVSSLFLLSCVLLEIITGQPAINETTDKTCPNYISCGSHGNLKFPLTNFTYSFCGLRSVDCSAGNHRPRIQVLPTLSLESEGDLNKGDSIDINDSNLTSLVTNQDCGFVDRFISFRRPSELLSSGLRLDLMFSFFPNMTIFKCSKINGQQRVDRDNEYFVNYTSHDCDNYLIYYNYGVSKVPDKWHPTCSSPIYVPVVVSPSKGTNMSDLFSLLASRFTLEFYVSDRCKNCYNSGGRNCLNGQGQCIISGPKEGRSTLKLKIGIAFGAIVAAAIPVLLLAFFTRRYRKTGFVRFRIKNQTEGCLNVEAFLKNNGSIAPKRYTHSDIKKMTNSFKIKLGQGGYGYVYKGQLKDNTLVAVKILDASKGTGEDFINEIASISRTSHVNVVTLLGYCFEGSKRSLVYEFMPNGSLEKYIYNNKNDELSPENSHKLGWETLYQIALGIARGLEYLHRGCNTPILHLDIKPHNILLDANFQPKIADFGLAKLCLKKESKVSLVGTRGTPGFIAPEVFSRSFGVISHKSDVYSYGMMVLEIVGQRAKNINETVDHTSDLYFPHWIYKWLEFDKEFNDLLDNEEGKETVRKMIIVGLWCIQINPEDRPSITRVVEMMVGSLDLLQVPPKPYLSCVPPLREDANSSSALQSLNISY